MMTANLDTAVVGGIIRLMCHAWGDGTSAPHLPADRAELRRISGCDTDETFTALSDALNAGGFWVTDLTRSWFPEQLAQYEKKATLSNKRAKAGGRGGLTKAARLDRARVLAITDADEIDGTWLKIRDEYPKRRGDHAWKEAQRHYRAEIGRGTLPSIMLAGVVRYAAWIRSEGKEGTPYVKQARTFFGPERCWEEPWEITPTSPRTAPLSTIASRMRDSFPVRS